MEQFRLTFGDSPIAAAAIHAGHAVRSSVAEMLALDEDARLREEDPYTDVLTRIASTRFIGCKSRFEFDLNRAREKAVYAAPEDAWGLHVWHGELPRSIIDESLETYDAFYAAVHLALTHLVKRFGNVVVLDLHSYNHRRSGAEGPNDDPAANPEINVGTGSVDREIWGPLVERFIGDLSAADASGRRLDVRENVKFRGGHFPQWINATFPGAVCAIAVEFKKTFMDEWTGELDQAALHELESALATTLPGLEDSLLAMRAPAIVQ
jgi:N-formylglutamate deformylase